MSITQGMLRTAVLWTKHLHALYHAPNGAAALATVFQYIADVHDANAETVITALENILEMEEKRVMATISEQLIEKGKKIGLEQAHAQMATISEQLIEKGKKQGLAQGVQQGLAQGERAVLTRLLERKFGPLPAEPRSRIESATQAQLEAWTDRVLTAQSLAEVME